MIRRMESSPAHGGIRHDRPRRAIAIHAYDLRINAVGGALLLLLAQSAAQTAHLSADLRLVHAVHSWMYTRGTRADGEQSTS